jgi:hypothetical protein
LRPRRLRGDSRDEPKLRPAEIGHPRCAIVDYDRSFLFIAKRKPLENGQASVTAGDYAQAGDFERFSRSSQS